MQFIADISLTEGLLKREIALTWLTKIKDWLFSKEFFYKNKMANLNYFKPITWRKTSTNKPDCFMEKYNFKVFYITYKFFSFVIKH